MSEQLKSLLIRLEACRKLEHGDLIPDEEIQALAGAVEIRRVDGESGQIDDGGGEVIQETQIGQ